MARKFRECLCDTPTCRKCLVGNCKDPNCSTHTAQAKADARKNMSNIHMAQTLPKLTANEKKIHDVLRDVAREFCLITYDGIRIRAKVTNLPRGMGSTLNKINKIEMSVGGPLLGALVVSKSNLQPTLRYENWTDEVARVWKFWSMK